jgi:hypothetical protein
MRIHGDSEFVTPKRQDFLGRPVGPSNCRQWEFCTHWTMLLVPYGW